MGHEDGIDLAEGLWQNLLTEVRATVYQQARLICLNKDRATGALVLRIRTPADLALAPDHRYAT